VVVKCAGTVLGMMLGQKENGLEIELLPFYVDLDMLKCLPCSETVSSFQVSVTWLFPELRDLVLETE
jgi:hypothetical protein